MSGGATAIFVGDPLTNNACQQSPISKTRPDRDIMVNREDMISVMADTLPEKILFFNPRTLYNLSEQIVKNSSLLRELKIEA